MNTIQALRAKYNSTPRSCKSSLLKFAGVGEKDVYNCSVPFEFNGKNYIFGRVEGRCDFADSVTMLFEQTGDDTWTRVEAFCPLPLEDPFVSFVNGEYVLGGTHVLKERGRVKTYFCYFYRGTDIFNLKYFTTGPEYMKDIRFVQLPENKIGVFSRPRDEEILAKYGTESQVGFTIISSLDELDAVTIRNAEYINGIFEQGEWGGINQAFDLGDGLIGAIGHQSYFCNEDIPKHVYLNTAYVIDIAGKKVISKEVIAQRADYPETAAKLSGLCDCCFTSGITGEKENTVTLYSGLSDVGQGKIIIPNPFIRNY